MRFHGRLDQRGRFESPARERRIVPDAAVRQPLGGCAPGLGMSQGYGKSSAARERRDGVLVRMLADGVPALTGGAASPRLQVQRTVKRKGRRFCGESSQ
jgi:hypothetical protein